jgi:hypothetical protein
MWERKFLKSKFGHQMKRGRSDDALTPWELQQLAQLPGVRARLVEELNLVHRCGSLVDAFANQTALLTHLLAYAWRSTNALMRTCKRFHSIVLTRDYWKALALHALANNVPPAILSQVNWFHNLDDKEPAYSYLWSCILNKRSAGYGLVPRFGVQDSTLFLSHFRADEISGSVRRVMRLRWHESKPCWYSLAVFCIAADHRPGEGRWWTPVYVTYFGHPRLRRRMFVTQERSIFHTFTDGDDDDDDDEFNVNRHVVINCYTECLDLSGTRVWHGEGPCVVREIDDEAGYATWNPSLGRDWGTWAPVG